MAAVSESIKTGGCPAPSSAPTEEKANSGKSFNSLDGIELGIPVAAPKSRPWPCVLGILVSGLVLASVAYMAFTKGVRINPHGLMNHHGKSTSPLSTGLDNSAQDGGKLPDEVYAVMRDRGEDRTTDACRMVYRTEDKTKKASPFKIPPLKSVPAKDDLKHWCEKTYPGGFEETGKDGKAPKKKICKRDLFNRWPDVELAYTIEKGIPYRGAWDDAPVMIPIRGDVVEYKVHKTKKLNGGSNTGMFIMTKIAHPDHNDYPTQLVLKFGTRKDYKRETQCM